MKNEISVLWYGSGHYGWKERKWLLWLWKIDLASWWSWLPRHHHDGYCGLLAVTMTAEEMNLGASRCIMVASVDVWRRCCLLRSWSVFCPKRTTRLNELGIILVSFFLFFSLHTFKIPLHYHLNARTGETDIVIIRNQSVRFGRKIMMMVPVTAPCMDVWAGAS